MMALKRECVAFNALLILVSVYAFVSDPTSAIGKQADSKRSYGNAKLTYCNPKYATNCSMVTFQRKDNGTVKLLTNVSVVFLVPVGNNVTVAGMLESTTGIRFKLDYAFCNYFKQKWLLDFFYPQEMKLPPPCPTPPGRFHLENLNIPPKKIPVPVRSGAYKLRLDFVQSNTKEILVTIDTYYNSNPKGRNKNLK